MRRNPNSLCHGLGEYEAYYPLPEGSAVSMADIHACWMFHEVRPENWSHVRLQVPVSEAWPWRLFRFRGHDADTPYWDNLKASMNADGWWEKSPLIIMFGRDGCITFEGNHRLQIARELGITHVPARIGGFDQHTCSYPSGILPYLMRQALTINADVYNCDWDTFRRAIDALMSRKRPYRRDETYDWPALVRDVIKQCRQAGKYGPQYQRPPGFYMLPGEKINASRQKEILAYQYRAWVKWQYEHMEGLGTTWPLKHVWPDLDEDEFERDYQRMHRGPTPFWLDRKDLAQWYAGRLDIPEEEWERRRPKRKSKAGQSDAEHEKAIDDIMDLLGGRR